jgi:outer membrane protein assembly factor BamD
MLKNKTIYQVLIVLIATLTFSSCSKYQKLLKSSDYELKYEKAVEYYEKGDYYKAKGLFDELKTILRGTNKAEKANYYYAYCTYELSEYTVASFLFKDFIRQYPSSIYNEEIMFLAAYCYFLISPEPSLEQTYTYSAINDFQSFINRYPNSEKRDKAQELLDKLRFKLETKAYNNAVLFFTIGEYKAANIALKNVLIDYPDTKYREDILLTILKSSYLLAENSITSKQMERHKETINAYYTFIDNFPESKNVKEAEKYYTNSLKFIEKSHGL